MTGNIYEVQKLAPSSYRWVCRSCGEGHLTGNHESNLRSVAVAEARDHCLAEHGTTTGPLG